MKAKVLKVLHPGDHMNPCIHVKIGNREEVLFFNWAKDHLPPCLNFNVGQVINVKRVENSPYVHCVDSSLSFEDRYFIFNGFEVVQVKFNEVTK